MSDRDSGAKLMIVRDGDEARAERIRLAAVQLTGLETEAAKKALRKLLRAERHEMCAAFPAKVKAADAAIQNALLCSDIYAGCGTLLVYASTAEETATWDVIERALADGKIVACPKCASAGKMDFFRISSIKDLEAGCFGIMEPREGCEAVTVFSVNDLCVVPGLAFDRSGRRIGYGGGYYDRFLAGFPGMTAGLCRADFLLDILPADEYDMRVKCVFCG